jgi:uncharacterized OB-fold protein
MNRLAQDQSDPTAWRGTLPVTNRYTYGLAGERFFRTIKDESKIFGTYCPKCNVTYVPAATFCERCLNHLDQWVDVGLVGVITTFTLLYVNDDGSARQEPEVVAFVRFGDGGLIHHLERSQSCGCIYRHAGRSRFKSPAERQGSILDIVYFKPKE